MSDILPAKEEGKAMQYGSQFIVTEKQINRDDFSVITMKDGRYLNFHYKLNIYHDVENDIYLLGNAWQTVPELDSPVIQLAALKNWGGISLILKTSCFQWRKRGAADIL